MKKNKLTVLILFLFLHINVYGECITKEIISKNIKIEKYNTSDNWLSIILPNKINEKYLNIVYISYQIKNELMSTPIKMSAYEENTNKSYGVVNFSSKNILDNMIFSIDYNSCPSEVNKLENMCICLKHFNYNEIKDNELKVDEVKPMGSDTDPEAISRGKPT